MEYKKCEMTNQGIAGIYMTVLKIYLNWVNCDKELGFKQRRVIQIELDFRKELTYVAKYSASSIEVHNLFEPRLGITVLVEFWLMFMFIVRPKSISMGGNH